MAPHATGSPPTRNSSMFSQTQCPVSTNSLSIAAPDPIAVVGLSFGFPQDATSSDDFWQILMTKRNTATSFPKDRMSIDAIYHPDDNRRGQISVRGGNFMKDDISAFDASFFNTSKADAAAMDPQQRGLLEYTYKALENAGMSLQSVSGSKTSVYTGCFTNDWQHIQIKDSEQCETTTALGTQACVNANRVSWFFNLTGNSANIDTACSSSLVALDLGCKGLQNGDTHMSIVAGCNLIFSPDMMHTLTNMKMLSPDGRCYSFDNRGNGYGRGEGFGVLILKKLSDALRDNDTIRSVIRSTGCNQDGFTPGITQPNPVSQEDLIRETYARAGLDMDCTRYFEAHGTGTPVGDPIEATAIGAAFRHTRTEEDPLWVGSVKSNIGHLEGASGIAGVIKTILILEKAVIPPNASLEQTNPKIDTDFLRIKFPRTALPWPTKGLRRASVNSFGFAGTNAHVVLDDVYHSLADLDAIANHMTVIDPPANTSLHYSVNGVHLNNSSSESPDKTLDQATTSRLLTFSTNDQQGLKRQAKAYAAYFRAHNRPSLDLDKYLDDLAYTLNLKRTGFLWRSFAIVRSLQDLTDLETKISSAQKSIEEPNLGFIFTGQGAQWARMGYELMSFPTYARSLLDAEEYFLGLGCSWSVREEIAKPSQQSNINRPEISQPVCTAVQIALVDLLSSLGVRPRAVVGHSSGEIAAAYCLGAISAKDAWKIAYYRGTSAASLAGSQKRQGAMLSVGLSQVEVQTYIDKVASTSTLCDLTIACINSPRNVTISGDAGDINTLKTFLNESHIFARKLLVDVAYHSSHMLQVANEYRTAISELEGSVSSLAPVAMISSVTGEKVSCADVATSDYWVANLVSPVRFSDAISNLFSHTARKIRRKLDMSHRDHFHINMLLEVGPHSALQGPTRDILSDLPNASTTIYSSLLARHHPAMDSFLTAIGKISCVGHPIDFDRMTFTTSAKSQRRSMILPNLPEYPFDHSQSYWYESRISNSFRTGHQGKLDLLGKPLTDWNPLEAKWRTFLRVSEMPWIEDHVINGALVYPGAGMIVMAIEAANQVANSMRPIEGFELSEVKFQRSLNIPADSAGIEVQLSLHLVQDTIEAVADWSEFRVCASENSQWQECCRGFIRVGYERESNEVDAEKESDEELRVYRDMNASLENGQHTSIDPNVLYETMRKSGYGFGPTFQTILRGFTGDSNDTSADITMFEWPIENHPQPHIIHPTSLDGLLHLSIAGYARGGNQKVPTMIPTSLRNLWISKTGLSSPEASQVRACTWLSNRDTRTFEFDGFALSESKSSVLAKINGLKLTKIADADADEPDESYANRQICYNIQHQPDPEVLHLAKDAFTTETTTKLTADEQFVRYLRALAHKKPAMKIIEIGAKDTRLTREILDALSSIKDGDKQTGQYQSYEYTGDSERAVDEARDALKLYPHLTFRAHDTSLDTSDHKDELGTYDLAVISTKSREIAEIKARLSYSRRLLSPTGKLLIQQRHLGEEPFLPGFAGLGANILGSCDYENLQSNSLQREGLLTAWDFSELQLRFSSGGQRFPVQDLLVVSPNPNISPSTGSRRVIFVADATSSLQREHCSRLMELLPDDYRERAGMASLEDAFVFTGRDNSIFVVLLELDAPFLYTLGRENYNLLRKFLLSAKDIIWVNNYGSATSPKPEHAVISGLARALRNEYEDLRLTTIALDAQIALREDQCRLINHVLLKNHVEAGVAGGEPEYVEVNGIFTIPRVVQDDVLSHDVFLRSIRQQSGLSMIKDTPSLKLAIGHTGLLDSLHYIEDEQYTQPLEENEVEIETRAIGMNFKDLLTALGQVPNETFGLECAGIVTRVGRSGDFTPGDRIIMADAASFRTRSRGKMTACCRIPETISFIEAATIPAQFGTAWEVVHEMARLRRGETILIHAGAGGTGQAAIQISQYLGAVVYTTVSSQSKKKGLMQEYGIPGDHIFYSRDDSFMKGIKRATKGRGVDVVINSLAGDSLIASWDCIAPYGRFVEIGKKDILSNSKLPMASFGKNATFIGFDMSTWYERKSEEAERDLKVLVDLFANKTFHPPRPLRVHSISEVEDVFRLMQDGKTSGKIVFEVSPDTQVQTTLATRPSFEFAPDATYVVAGGLGGLGRSMARWIVARKAKNLILLSRSGVRTDAARELLEEMKDHDVHVEAPACDVTNANAVHEVFRRLGGDMPPIKGCIQGSMVRRDELFENMEYDGWAAGVECKTVGSWNLHSALPTGMDFFIFLSSASGLVGLRGQTNYAAGNTYEDALARHRVAHGEKAVSLDLGAMIDDGLLAETPELLNRVLAYGALNPVSRQQFYGILDYYCNPELPLLTPQECQVVIGLGVGGGPGLDGVDLNRQPMLRHLIQASTEQAISDSSSGEDIIDFRSLIRGSASLAEAGNFVVQSLIKKLSKSLSSMQDDNIDIDKPLHTYGVDSLLAVELRNWISKEFQADVAVFETLGGSTFSSLGMLVAGRSGIAHPAWNT